MGSSSSSRSRWGWSVSLASWCSSLWLVSDEDRDLDSELGTLKKLSRQ